ncbi:MAG: SPOR domain-containing protein [Bacteroidales bacterium]|nr:SPOR domain-containing protein [Bacteroidales bacterium]
MGIKKKQLLEIKVSMLVMVFFILSGLDVMADPPEKRFPEKATFPEVVNPSTGDFLPDSVNVFEIAKDVSQIFSEAMKYTSLNDVKGDTAYLQSLFTTNYATNAVAEAYKKDVEARIKSQKGDLGVDFKADYAENFKPGFSADEDIYYKRRFYFGVEWNVIKGGFLEARAKAKQLEGEYYLKDVDAQKRADAENYRYIFNYINYLFNKQKIDVLKERYQLIEQQLNFTNELYHLRYVGWENVLNIRAKLEDLNQQIAQLENFNKHIPNSIPEDLLGNDFTAESLPLVDIDLEKLMSIYHDNKTTDTIAALKLAMYEDGMKWWKDVSLKPYLRYNLYVDPLNATRRFGNGGVSLSVPLRFKHKNDLISAQEDIYTAEGMAEFQAGDNELVNHYAEFAFKLKQIKDFYFKKLFADELIRKELVKKDYKDIGFNPIFTLGLIDDKKNIEAEIIDIKKRLYIQLVQMAFYLDKKSPLDFVEILNPREFTSRYATGVQVFLDKSTFNSMETHELVNYLWKNEFRDVVIEIDSWNFGPKFKEVVAKASRDHIYFTLNMKIPEGTTFPDVNADLQELAALNNEYINGLHYSLVLDQNSSSDREIQEVNFSDWLDGIDVSSKAHNVRLSISIADNLPMNVLNKVYDKFDLVFVPSDGTPNREQLENKLVQELALGKDKLTVVLNANDFADRLHIENYMTNLNTETGVENFAFSNMKSMIEADLRTYQKGEKNQIASEDLLAAFRNQIFADEAKNEQYLADNLDSISQNVEEAKALAEANNNPDIDITITDLREEDKLEVKTETSKTNNQSKVWQVQFAASKVSLTDNYLKNKFNISETITTHRVDGYYKYTIGEYTNQSEARAALKNYKAQSGNEGAFVVSYE